MYRYRCPKCRTAYYSAASKDTLKPCICYVCQHTVVYVEDSERQAGGDREAFRAAGARERKAQGRG